MIEDKDCCRILEHHSWRADWHSWSDYSGRRTRWGAGCRRRDRAWSHTGHELAAHYCFSYTEEDATSRNRGGYVSTFERDKKSNEFDKKYN
jgi:hypothetical protein